MKNTLLGLAFLTAAVSYGQQDLDQLAKRIVNVSAGIKPGHVVVVYGGKHTLPLMESLSE